MKKIVKLSLTFIIMICMIFSITAKSFAAISCGVTISSASEVKKGDTFTVTFNLSKLQSDKGINALIGTLKYDKNSLTLVKMEGQNDWSKPSYNEADGTFVIERDEYATKDGSFLKVTFEVRDKSAKNVNVSMEGISVSNEFDEINVNSASKNITVKERANTSNQKPNTNNQTSSTTNKNNKTDSEIKEIKDKNETIAKKEKLPYTGSNTAISIISIGAVAIITTVLFVKMKINNK